MRTLAPIVLLWRAGLRISGSPSCSAALPPTRARLSALTRRS